MRMASPLFAVKPLVLAGAIAVGLFAQCQQVRAAETETVLVAGGCFWCVEADFERVDGVIEAVSGFAGGSVPNPTYKEVTRGGTGHLEAVSVTFDPDQISARQLYDLFLRSIDVTDADGQFCDRGENYSSAVFALTPEQRQAALAAKAAAEAALGREIVTPVREAARFYAADDYHQDYYKSDDLILFSRFGPTQKSSAYKRYREACGRDARVSEIWGADAPFLPTN